MIFDVPVSDVFLGVCAHFGCGGSPSQPRDLRRGHPGTPRLPSPLITAPIAFSAAGYTALDSLKRFGHSCCCTLSAARWASFADHLRRMTGRNGRAPTGIPPWLPGGRVTGGDYFCKLLNERGWQGPQPSTIPGQQIRTPHPYGTGRAYRHQLLCPLFFGGGGVHPFFYFSSLAE